MVEKTRSTAHRKSSLEMAVDKGQRSKQLIPSCCLIDMLMGCGSLLEGKSQGLHLVQLSAKHRKCYIESLLSVLDGKEVRLSK